jgi:hypothetical protein
MKMPKFMQHFVSKKLMAYIVAIVMNWLILHTGFPPELQAQFSDWLLNLSLGAMGAFSIQDVAKELKAGVEAKAKAGGKK